MVSEPRSERWDNLTAAADALGESPHHGFQGDRAPAPVREAVPAALTVAISREAGSRGSTIAGRAGAKLGWQVYNQELLEYIAQEGTFQQDIVENCSPAATRWAEEQLRQLARDHNPRQHPSLLNLARIILALGAKGEVILVGRGAGCILPAKSTLHVRIMAPLPDRIAYMSQWLRLTPKEAAEQVQARDSRRSDFITSHFQRQASDVHQYDLVLNSSLLGEDSCAELIAQAARAKHATLTEISA
jgi:cytidylate kinase